MHLSHHRLKIGFILTSLLLIVFVGGWYIGIRATSKYSPFHTEFLNPYLTKDKLQEKIAKLPNSDDVYHYRTSEVNLEGYNEPVVLDYALDPAIQTTAEDLLDHYKPDLGALVAIDASTGRILAMVGENRAFEIEGHPALKMSYPSASVFKVITATAAFENNKGIDPNTVMAYSGKNHTLYKYQDLKERLTGWKRSCSLKEAFAKSINTVFGRLGVFTLGKDPLKSCSTRYAFDEAIPSEFPVAMSHSANPENDFELAEMASGYTQHNVMTPVHGALIAAAIANDGVMMEPYFLNAAYLKSGKPVYRSEPAVFAKVMTKDTADELKKLMRETVVSGTGRKSFHGFFKGQFSELDVGGKTGSLTDQTLHGKIDWFVGFAQSHGRKIAISVMTMHKKYWVVKSSYLARKTIESAFSVKKVASK
jgi:peptidoglycan glycosyltransferase